MIASINGELQAIGSGWLIVSVGGIGIRVEVAEGRVVGAHVGETVFLHTHLVVREDSLTLFGFQTLEELEVFGLLLAVSGVGPRSALGALAALTPAQIARAVQLEDDKAFRQISGVGPKTAKLIAVSLAGKLIPQRYLASEDVANAQGEGAIGMSRNEAVAIPALVVQGLIGLGYQESQAETAVRDAQNAGIALEQSALLRGALRLLQTPTSSSKSHSNGKA